MNRCFCFLFCVALSHLTVPAICSDQPIRVLIIDGRNNHAWEGTTTSIRQTLFQTVACSTVDVSTSPIRYPKPYPARPRNPTAEQQAEYDSAVAAWRAEEKKYEASIAGEWDQWRPKFADYDVVVDNYNGPEWPTAVKDDFVDFVRNGGGVIVLHAANNCFPDWDEFNQMLGLGWRKTHQGIRVAIDPATDETLRQPVGDGPNSGHGSKHPFVVTTRTVEHPIMKGLPAEWMHGKDELYHAMRGPAKGVEVLATAFSDAKQRGTGLHEPVVWATHFGKGRVVTNTMGHYWVGGDGPTMRHSLHCVGFQTVLARSCQWAAGRDVTIDVPDEFPPPDEVSIVHPEKMHWAADGKTLPFAPQAIQNAKERVTLKKSKNPYSLLTPAESISSIQLPDGFELELVLEEPVIREPVLAAWDGNGRMFVAEMRSYMQDEYGTGTKTLKNGRISRHEDTTGDGKLDRHTVFIDNLNLPRMMLPLDDRLAVVETDTTDIYTYRDTDGDGVADEKKLIYDGSRKIDSSRSVEH